MTARDARLAAREMIDTSTYQRRTVTAPYTTELACALERECIRSGSGSKNIRRSFWGRADRWAGDRDDWRVDLLDAPDVE